MASPLPSFRRFFIVVALFSGACSNPRDTVLPQDPEKWETTLPPIIKQLSEEDRKHLSSYMARATASGVFGGQGIPVGYTVGQAIAADKEFEIRQAKEEAEAKKLKEKLQKERAEKLAMFNQAVRVVLLRKGFHNSDPMNGDYEDRITIVLGFENKTDKAIAGVKGVAKFADMFGDEIMSSRIAYDETIQPHSTAQWSAGIDYNQFMDEHQKLRSTAYDRIQFTFEPSVIIFSDGSKIEAPEDSDAD